MIVNAAGHPLYPPVEVPPEATATSIKIDGTIVSTVNGKSKIIGQIKLANFVAPEGLITIGGNLFQPTSKSGNPIIGTPGTNNMGTLIMAGLESSNVNLPEEMANLILSQRGLEANLKAFQTAVDLTGTLLDIKK